MSFMDFSNPGFVMAAIMAAASDFAFIFIIGLLIPGVGLVIAAGVGLFHYLAGAVVLGLTFHNLKHFIPKLILALAVLLPLPLLSIGLILAIIAQNRLVEFVITQTAIQAIAFATGGAGEVLEGVAVTGTVAEAGATAVEVGEAAVKAGEVAGEVAEAGSGVAKTGEALEKTAEGAGRAKKIAGKARQAYEAGEEQGEKTEEEKSRERAEELEEIYGVEEPTEKMQELFEPEYNAQDQKESGLEDEIAARQRFEARKQEEVGERRRGEGGEDSRSASEKANDYVVASDRFSREHENEIIAYGNGVRDARAAGNEDLARAYQKELDAVYASGPRWQDHTAKKGVDEVELSENENEINLKEAA